MYASKRVPSTEDSYDDRQWVKIDDFLSCFPEASDVAKQQFHIVMRMLDEETVEKRIHETLVNDLCDRCLSAEGNCSFNSPTVTKDGWVFWTSGYHTELLDALAALYINEDYADDWEFFAANAGWTISTMDCKSIMVPREYRPNKEDKEIFELFNIVKMQW